MNESTELFQLASSQLYPLVSDLVKPVTKHFEGLRLAAYTDPGGLWTIGYGHRCSASQADITEAEAQELLENDLKAAYDQLIKESPGLLLQSPGRLAALTDFVFNLGVGRYLTSHLKVVVDSTNWEQVPEQLRRWVFDGKTKEDGLVARREAEVNLWNL